MTGVRTLCGMCIWRCSVAVGPEGVGPAGERPCVKGRAMLQWLRAPDRLLRPLVGGREASWEEALEAVAGGLARVRDRHGARSVGVVQGYQALATQAGPVARRFCDLFGTPNYASAASLCYFAKVMGNSLTFNHRGIFLEPNLERSRCILVWGANPAASAPPVQRALQRARRRGARLIVVDPRLTPLARRAEVHLRPRPGTDLALALGMLHVLVEEGRVDRGFLPFVHGLDRLADHLRRYHPREVERLCGVAADDVRRAVRLYAEGPASILRGVSLDHSPQGVQAHRALACLIALSGNYDRFGGNAYVHPPPLEDLRPPERPGLAEAVAADLPLYQRISGETSATSLVRAVLEDRPYPVRALILDACNPLLTFPNARLVQRALQRLELLVVIDHFLTPTARLAHVALPAAAFPERWELVHYAYFGRPLVRLCSPALQAPGDCWPPWRIWAELGRRLGQSMPWGSDEELLGQLLRPLGARVEAGGMELQYEPRRERKYLGEGFGTPSGKAELWSELLAQHGHDPLPDFHPVREGGMLLVTGTREPSLTGSQHRNVPTLRDRSKGPGLRVHPEDLRALGLRAGRPVTVRTGVGQLRLTVRPDRSLPRGTAWLPFGWPEANANLLTDDRDRDPISGYPNLRSIPCELEP